jgi:hypothetical protein
LQPGSARAAAFWNAILRLAESCPASRLEQLDAETLDTMIDEGQLAP